MTTALEIEPERAAAFDLSTFLNDTDHQTHWAFRVVSIGEDGYLNVNASTPSGRQFVALYVGEAFQIESAKSSGGANPELSILSIRNAGDFLLRGAVEFADVMVAPVMSGLSFRSPDLVQRHAHSAASGGHRSIGPYTVCGPTEEYWLS
jgi:hypothetical protein